MHNWSFFARRESSAVYAEHWRHKNKTWSGKVIKTVSGEVASGVVLTLTWVACSPSLRPVLAQVPVANWPVINHIHCELHDQLREPEPLCSLNVSAVHFSGSVNEKCPQTTKTHQGEERRAVACSVVRSGARDLPTSGARADNASLDRAEWSC